MQDDASAPAPVQRSVAVPKAIALFRQSYQILRGDKELVLYPLISGVASLLAAAGLYGIYMLLDQIILHRPYAPGSQLSGDDYLFLFVLYLVESCIVVYFNTALAASVLHRFNGGDPTFSYGLDQANKRRSVILKYALLAALVGVLLRFIAEKLGVLGKIFSWITEVAWSVATFFIAPVLVASDLSPIAAIKESERIFVQTWGKAVKGVVGFAGIAFAGALVFGGLLGVVVVSFEPEAGVSLPLKIAGIVVCLGLFIGFILVYSACSAIYRTALYYYATSKNVPAGYDSNLPASVNAR